VSEGGFGQAPGPSRYFAGKQGGPRGSVDWSSLQDYRPPLTNRRFWAVQALVIVIAVAHSSFELAGFTHQLGRLYFVPISLLVVSHVLGELDDRGREQLLRLARRAEAVLWAEPGSFQSSRDLITNFREHLRGEFHILAPCTHQAVCGLMAPENTRHWCHNFADPPAGIMGDSNWVRFAKRAGIDLRSLPYSFLALEKHSRRSENLLSVSGCSRIIGEPRHYKGHALVTSCQEDGVYDLTLRKRDAPALFKALKDCGEALIYRWDRADDRILAAHRPDGDSS
jgi:hypothetical protein